MPFIIILWGFALVISYFAIVNLSIDIINCDIIASDEEKGRREE